MLNWLAFDWPMDGWAGRHKLHTAVWLLATYLSGAEPQKHATSIDGIRMFRITCFEVIAQGIQSFEFIQVPCVGALRHTSYFQLIARMGVNAPYSLLWTSSEDKAGGRLPPLPNLHHSLATVHNKAARVCSQFSKLCWQMCAEYNMFQTTPYMLKRSTWTMWTTCSFLYVPIAIFPHTSNCQLGFFRVRFCAWDFLVVLEIAWANGAPWNAWVPRSTVEGRMAAW